LVVDDIEVKVTNTLGEIIQTTKVQQLKTQIDLNQFAHGIYFLSLYKNNQLLVTKKVVKQ